MKYLCVIVLYKCGLYECKTYQTFLKKYLGSDNLGIFIYDNSPEPLHDKVELIADNIEYVSDTSNSGVSRAYNEGALFAKRNGYEWLILLDQDTDFGIGDYFSTLRENIMRFPEERIFVPTAKSCGGELISPSYFGYGLNRKFRNGVNAFRNYSFINSGMCVSLSFFLSIGGYNEKVPLDYSDHQFSERCRKNSPSFVILDYCLSQDYSDEIFDLDRAIGRYKLFCKGAYNFETKSLNTKLYIIYEVVKHTLSLSIKYRSGVFVNTLLQTSKNEI